MANTVCPNFRTVYIGYTDHPMHPDFAKYFNSLMNFDFDFLDILDPQAANFINNDVPTVIKEKIKTHLVNACIHTDPADLPTAEQLEIMFRC